MPQRRPRLPLPAPLRGEEDNTWAQSTITERLPNIAQRVLDENDYPAATVARVQTLIEEIPRSPIRFLASQTAPDAAAWRSYVRPYLGQNWLEPPWFFAETYFYRRVLEAVTYFEPEVGPQGDPFAYQKRQGLTTTRAATEAAAAQLAQWVAAGWQADAAAKLLAGALWGNQADLSLWPAEDEAQPQHGSEETAREHLLVDDTAAVVAYLAQRPAPRIDVIADNAGFELIGDLALVDYLLTSGRAARVHVHVKMHPTFVSDAMIKDVADTVAFLRAEETAAVREFGERLAGHRRDGRLLLHDHPFWTSPLPLWEMPDDLYDDLSQSQLIISKGDANYRRLLGDRHWPFTTPFAAIMSYAPAPVLALRTLKAELAAGLTEAQVARLEREDPAWLVSGRWGVIQAAMI